MSYDFLLGLMQDHLALHGHDDEIFTKYNYFILAKRLRMEALDIWRRKVGFHDIRQSTV
jgi:hypothetical protein